MGVLWLNLQLKKSFPARMYYSRERADNSLYQHICITFVFIIISLNNLFTTMYHEHSWATLLTSRAIIVKFGRTVWILKYLWIQIIILYASIICRCAVFKIATFKKKIQVRTLSKWTFLSPVQLYTLLFVSMLQNSAGFFNIPVLLFCLVDDHQVCETNKSRMIIN